LLKAEKIIDGEEMQKYTIYQIELTLKNMKKIRKVRK